MQEAAKTTLARLKWMKTIFDVAFSPGEGSTVEREVAAAIMGAQNKIRIASMVISSGPILGALIDANARKVDIAGVYDGPEMNVVKEGWAKGTRAPANLINGNSLCQFWWRSRLPFIARMVRTISCTTSWFPWMTS